jgi:quercetin dioxygenase-like cupin family protein
LISVIQPTQKTMKKIALILILPLVLSLAAVAAQKKDASKKSTESATSEQHVVLNPADLKWGDAPPGLPPGAKLAVLAGDPNKKGLFTVRLQTPAGYKVPPHTHPTSEHITVISGTFNIGTGDKFDEAAGKEMGRWRLYGHAAGDEALCLDARGSNRPGPRHGAVCNQIRESSRRSA